jgi:outer membrane lipoprotein-sorting protein
VICINMKIYRSIVLILASFFFIGWGDSWDQIRKTAVSITSIEADFTQEKHMEILSRPLVSRGKMYFKAPKSLRWEYREPVRSILMMHGGTVTRYIIKGDSVIRDSSAGLQSMQVVLQEIAMWMKGNFDADPGFRPELRPGRIIELVPKDKSMSDIIQRIRLKLSNVPGVIDSVSIYESKKSYTAITFSRVKLNLGIPDSLFKEIK